MAFTNLPPNLQDMFYNLQDQINKLVTGPNQAMYTAESAQAASAQALSEAATANAQGVYALQQANIAIAQGTQAINDANNALQQAQASYAVSSQAIIKSANTITNASNQLTSINGNGISVYAGSSGTGARVVLNSAGLVGYNVSNSPTFTLDASNGNVSMTGALFTGGTISGGSLNINGACIIESNGKLTATNAVITGNVTATSGTFTGTVYASAGTFTGTITSSNATITGGSLTVGSNFSVNTSGNLIANNATITGSAYITSGWLGNASSGWQFTSSGYIQSPDLGTILYPSAAASTNALITDRRVTADSFSTSTNTANNAYFTQGGITATGSSAMATLTTSTMLYVSYATSASTTAATNCYISSTGQILKTSTTSSVRYKENITDIYNVEELNPKLLLQIPVKAFTYKNNHIPENDDRANQMLPGFIAEDVDAIYPIAADYSDGNVETWSERYIIPGLLALIQDQEKRIKILEGK